MGYYVTDPYTTIKLRARYGKAVSYNHDGSRSIVSIERPLAPRETCTHPIWGRVHYQPPMPCIEQSTVIGYYCAECGLYERAETAAGR